MMGKRNAYALAARQRKAGAHSGRRRPDVFDRINGYTDDEMEALKRRCKDCGEDNQCACGGTRDQGDDHG